MPKTKSNDWRNRELTDWNVTTFHAYLIETNREKYGVEYLPFGSGPVSKRWATEKGQLKQAVTKHGPEVVKAFIDRCFESHRFNPDFPSLSFGFMYAYMRNELTRAEVAVAKQKEIETAIEDSDTKNIDEEWF